MPHACLQGRRVAPARWHDGRQTTATLLQDTHCNMSLTPILNSWQPFAKSLVHPCCERSMPMLMQVGKSRGQSWEKACWPVWC